MLPCTFYDLVIRKTCFLIPVTWCKSVVFYSLSWLQGIEMSCWQASKKVLLQSLVAIENILSESGSWNLSNKIWLVCSETIRCWAVLMLRGFPFLVLCTVSQCVFVYILLLLNQLTHLNWGLTDVCASYYYEFKKMYRQIEGGEECTFSNTCCAVEKTKSFFSPVQWKITNHIVMSIWPNQQGEINSLNSLPMQLFQNHSCFGLRLNGNCQGCCFDSNTYLKQEKCSGASLYSRKIPWTIFRKINLSFPT